MPSRQAISAKRIRQINQAAGLCAVCGSPRAPGAYRCARCNAARREYNRLAKQKERARQRN